MSKPHKWADVIHAWADGRAIQFREPRATWSDLGSETSPIFDVLGVEWRIKPEPKVLRYRLALMAPSRVVAYDGETADLQHSVFFIRWLGDWQTVEIEDGE